VSNAKSNYALYCSLHCLTATGMVVQAHVKANSQSNETGKFRPPGQRNPHTDFDETWNIELCRRCNHTCKYMSRCDNVGGLGEQENTWLVTCWSLSIPF